MTNYTASNGVILNEYGVALQNPYAKDSHEARKEFYQHLRDQELGRWRDPENHSFHGPTDEASARAVFASIDPEELANVLHAWDVEGGPCEGPFEDLTDTQKETWRSAAHAVINHLLGETK